MSEAGGKRFIAGVDEQGGFFALAVEQAPNWRQNSSLTAVDGALESSGSVLGGSQAGRSQVAAFAACAAPAELDFYNMTAAEVKREIVWRAGERDAAQEDGGLVSAAEAVAFEGHREEAGAGKREGWRTGHGIILAGCEGTRPAFSKTPHRIKILPMSRVNKSCGFKA